MTSTFATSFADASALLEQTRNDASLMAKLDTVADWLTAAFQSGNKAIACGNGGSLADAMHFAEEWTGRFRRDRDPFPAIALADPTHLTCTANDFGYDHVFERGVRAYGKEGDLLILLSTSGNSRNLIVAAEAARRKGVKTAAFLGKGGGPLAPICDIALVFPGETSDRIQELHMLSLHALIETVEARLGV